MNNPARHNLDDVTLRAEDGEIVIETDSGEIAATISGSLNIDDLISAENAEFTALEAGSVNTDALNNAIYASPTGNSVRDAVGEAGTGGSVLIDAGFYDESGSNLSVEDMTIIGLGEVTIDMGSNRLEVQGQSYVRDITVENNGSSFRPVRTMNGGRPVLVRVNTENEAENESIRLSAEGSRLFAGTHIVPDAQDDSVVIDADDCMVMGNNIDSGIRELGSDNYPTPFGDFNNIF